MFAASIKQHPQRLVMLTEGDSWFSYPLNANIADYIEMMSDFSLLRLEHNGDEAREILGAGSEQLKKIKYYLKNYPVDALLLSAGGNDLVSGELAKVLEQEGQRRHLAERHQARRANYRARRHRGGVFAAARCARHAAAQVRGDGAQLLLLPADRPQGDRAVRPRQGRSVDAAGARRQGHRPRHRGPRPGALPGRRTARAARWRWPRRGRAFSVVDMRAALPVDNVHWADEIHPSGTGFRRLAEDHWRPLLKAQFPGRGFD